MNIHLFWTDVSLYQSLYFFLLYGFLGWICEVVFSAFKTGKFVNRGFLSGPICPLYGTGALLVIITTDKFINQWWLVFIVSTVLTSSIEFITGFILEKAFHRKWWDYSNRRFNLLGYVCLEFSIIWGILCTFVIIGLNRPFYYIINNVHQTFGLVIILILLVIFLIDVVTAIINATKYRNRFVLLSRLDNEIKKSSDFIGLGIYNTYEKAVEKYNSLIELIAKSRLSQAFPNLLKHLRIFEKKETKK